MLVLVLLGIVLFIPMQSSAQDRHEQFPDFYPPSFDGKGKINEIVSERAVIGDRQFHFHANVTFNTPDVRQCSRYMFDKGDYVGFKLNEKEQIVPCGF